MQADQNNYQPDKQFTNQGWNEMLKTLDKEMPVQEKKRRGFFWLFPLLLIGGIASVWAFYPKNESTEITQGKEVVIDQSKSQSQSQSQSQISKKTSETTSKNNIELTNENIATDNQTTEINSTSFENRKPKVKDGFPSIIESSNPLSPQVIEEIVPVEKTEVIEQKAPIAKLEEEVRAINPSFITIQLQDEEKLSIAEKEFFFEEETIVKKPNAIKRKTEFGVFAGVVSDFANINKVGFTSGGTVHFPIGKKLGLRTGLGYSQLQKELPYSFIGNQDALLSPEFIDVTTALPPFSSVAVQSNSDFVLEKFHQVDLPVLFTYSPIKKIQFQLGASASYLVKEKISLINNSIKIDESVNDNYSIYGIELDVLDLNSISQNQYSEENYWGKLNLSGVAGFAWKPTRRFNLELQYHHGFFPILKSSRKSISGSLIQGDSTTNRYEVFNNSDNSFAPESRSIKNLFNKDRFIKKNHSLRLTIGYNF
ncbi:MAG: outer membrane beta-barrel protein [Saprospiraceae bacterium]